MPNKLFGTAATSGGPSTFYLDEDPEVPADFRDLLVNYGNVADGSVKRHIRNIRNRAWNIAKFPCLGLYLFTDIAITEHPRYPEVLNALKQSTSDNPIQLLDLGCCLGQDLRKLAYDGAPSNHLHGYELSPAFVELGYDLFNDRSTFDARFMCGDFFAESETKDSNGRALEVDFIHAGSFFHLFNWDEQVVALCRAVRLLKVREGSMIFGKQIGAREARVIPHTTARSGTMFRHDEASFRRLVGVVEERTGVELEVEVACFRHECWEEETENRVLQFAVRVR